MNYSQTGAAIVLAWLTFPIMFALIARRSKNAERRRDPVSLLGMFLQFAPYPFMVALRREPGSPIVPVPAEYNELVQNVVNITAVGLVWFSVVLTFTALKALGRHWNLAARVVEGHKLVRSGPYRFVRHPIYTSMICVNVSGALAFSRWEMAIAVVVLSAVGTWIRVRSEDRLMNETFGTEFKTYAASVPAVIPWFRLRAS